jgi:hypothetical protein
MNYIVRNSSLRISFFFSLFCLSLLFFFYVLCLSVYLLALYIYIRETLWGILSTFRSTSKSYCVHWEVGQTVIRYILKLENRWKTRKEVDNNEKCIGVTDFSWIFSTFLISMSEWNWQNYLCLVFVCTYFPRDSVTDWKINTMSEWKTWHRQDEKHD